MKALRLILDDYDPSVKESACWAISYIAKHSLALAKEIVDCITINKLIECLREPEIGLKRIAVNCLMQIAKHSEELAKEVVSNDEDFLKYLCPLIFNDDILLKR